jgi:hypothetical protein
MARLILVWAVVAACWTEAVSFLLSRDGSPLRARGSVRLAAAASPPAGMEGACRAHAASLRERGFAVLAEPVIEEALVARARTLTQDRLARLLSDVDAVGCSALGQQYRFKELVHRQRNRWDLQLLADPRALSVSGVDAGDGKTLQQLCEAVMECAAPIIREASGQLDVEPLVVGAVISRPGASVQRFHCDVAQDFFRRARKDPSQRLYNLFVPLVDWQQRGDGTEFWPAASLDDSLGLLASHFLACETGAFPSPLDPDDLCAPACSAGGLVLFDYRTIHRCGGTAAWHAPLTGAPTRASSRRDSAGCACTL